MMEIIVIDLASRARMGQYAAMTVLNGLDDDDAKDLLWAFRQVAATAKQLTNFYKPDKA